MISKNTDRTLFQGDEKVQNATRVRTTAYQVADQPQLINFWPEGYFA